VTSSTTYSAAMPTVEMPTAGGSASSTAGAVELGDLPEPDRGQGDDRHVQRVAGTPALGTT
jgi:hypothetical protein